MKISVVGTGYVGLITGVCFAELGNKVILADVILDKVEKINRGIPPIYEEKLDKMLAKNLSAGRVHATTHTEKAVLGSDITFISVGTPCRRDGSIDLTYVKKAAADIGKALKGKKGRHTVVMKSTVVPGTTEHVVIPILEKNSGLKAGKDFGVAMNPEFLREGKAIDDFMSPDRIIIGGIDDESITTVGRLYKDFRCPLIRTGTNTAEMIKYASNAFLATKISFINEIGNMCKELGIDTYEVAEGMGYDKRIQRSFLNSGEGYGGSCFPKDVKAIMAKSRNTGIKPRILEAVEYVNDRQPLKIIEILKKRVPGLKNKTIAVLGLSFKPGTDDIRDAPSIKVVKSLLDSGASVNAYDRQATENFKKIYRRGISYYESAQAAIEGADACLLLTEWPEFEKLTDEDFNVMRGKVIIEGRKILDPKKVKNFEGVCW
jgi:UDPglucose 6-dehydrogenase